MRVTPEGGGARQVPRLPPLKHTIETMYRFEWS